MARLALALALALALPACVRSCSRAVFNQGGEDAPVVTARTMDWGFSFDDFLLVNPRGRAMDGGLGNASSSKTWTSRYASVVSSINGWLSTKDSSQTGARFDFQKDGAADGVNEAGLAAHLLELQATVYNSTAPSAPTGVTYARWVRYLLDTCATVQEAVAAMRDVQIVGVLVGGTPDHPGASFGVHLAVEDRSGDSAVFEVLDGALVTHHGRTANLTVMTNDPPLPEQLENLKRYRTLGGEEPLPGNTGSADRFARLSYFLRYVPRTQDAAAMAGYMKTVISSVAVPQGAPYGTEDPKDGTFPTWWTSIVDVRNQVYHWQWTLNPNMLSVDLASLAAGGRLKEGAPTLVLNPRKPSLAGEVSREFRPRLHL